MNLDLESYHSEDQADEEENEDSQQFHFSVVNRVETEEQKLNCERETLAETSSLVSHSFSNNIFKRVIQTVVLH
jgi:hypothetical protein